MRELLTFLFGNYRKTYHLRKKAEKFLLELKRRKLIKVEEAKKLIGAKKTYYKIIRKLKWIGLVKLIWDYDGYFFTLDLQGFKKKFEDIVKSVEATLT